MFIPGAAVPRAPVTAIENRRCNKPEHTSGANRHLILTDRPVRLFSTGTVIKKTHMLSAIQDKTKAA